MRVVELDLFRFFAAFGVVLYHYVAWYVLNHPQNSPILDSVESVTRYGYMGVPLFFMISGFVILASALNRTNLEFAISRVTRLYPVYWLCVSLTAVLIFYSKMGNDSLDMVMYLVNMTMLQSYVGVGDVDGVYWTLAKEIQFYLCIFILLSFRVIHQVRIWVSIWIVLIITFRFFQQPFFLGMFISPEYSPFFIAGVAMFMIRKEGQSVFYLAVLLVSAILACDSIYQIAPNMTKHRDEYVRWVSICINLAMFMVFYAVASHKIKLSIRPLYLIIGGLTYPLYLIHNVAGKIVMDSMVKSLGPEAVIVIACILAIFVSFIIYQYYEKRVATPLKRALLSFSGRLFRKQTLN